MVVAELVCGGWWTVLSRLADHEQNDDEKRQLLTEATSKFDKAIKFKPDYHEAYENCGAIMLKFVHIEDDPIKKQDLLKKAEVLFQKAETLKSGSTAYNMGCCFAMQGHPDKCRHWLAIAEQYGTLVTKKHAMEDKDLESVLGKKWSQELKWKDAD